MVPYQVPDPRFCGTSLYVTYPTTGHIPLHGFMSSELATLSGA